MQRERRTRFWVIVGLVAAIGMAADWWFFRRCPPVEAAEPHPCDAEWVQAEERRIVAAAGEDLLKMRVRNVSGRHLETRFTGLFVARYAEARSENLLVLGGKATRYRSRLGRFDLPPLVLEIGAGRSITLRIPGEGKSAKDGTALLGCHDPIPQAEQN
jgi:hypothetical protein